MGLVVEVEEEVVIARDHEEVGVVVSPPMRVGYI